jgi:alpha-glucosidase
MSYTGQKPVDPLIVNVWPLEPGASSSYKVYEDSGVGVEYQKGVFTETPIRAKQTGDELSVEIGPVEGSFPGMMKERSYEIRLPADWPPESATVNGAEVKHAGPTDKDGWSFEGNTLTTVIPVPASSVEGKVTVVVRRAAGLTARRGELDGFAGAMTRLRGAYDSMHATWPVSDPPDVLTDAMQTGDRLGYHPERAAEEIALLREMLPKAQAAIEEIGTTFAKAMTAYEKRMATSNWRPADNEAEKQLRLDALARAQKQLAEAGK